jgi:hypothetical protein
MAVRAGNVKGISNLGSYRGGEKAVVLQVSFDLLNTASTGGTDTITLGNSAGYDQGVANTTQTLAQMIATRVRGSGGAFTIVSATPYVPGYQAGLPLYATGPVVSGGNVTSIAIQTLLTGGSGQNTTSAGWDSAASILVVGSFANQGGA